LRPGSDTVAVIDERTEMPGFGGPNECDGVIGGLRDTGGRKSRGRQEQQKELQVSDQRSFLKWFHQED
jgi:hypothetical protein